jgi:Mg2+ and Co2+ transporter CorA
MVNPFIIGKKTLLQLVLSQRAIILKLFDDISNVSSIKSTAKNRKEITEKVSVLHKSHLEFMTKIYKPRVTAQEQGIEIYDHLQKSMDIAQNLECLDKEIKSLHNYANLLEEKQMSKAQHRLGVYGAIILIPSFLLSFLGSGLLQGDSSI